MPYHDCIETETEVTPTAHGLAFSSLVKVPPSLQNIYKEIRNEFPTYIIPRTGDLTGWKDQGVLLLNSFLTVIAHQSTSHMHIGWEIFTDKVIKIVSHYLDNVVFMLWGNFAKAKQHLIDDSKHLILTSAHPSPLSAHNGFFWNNHFKDCNEYLSENNKEEIKW